MLYALAQLRRQPNRVNCPLMSDREKPTKPKAPAKRTKSAGKAPTPPPGVTPSMAQYLEIKAANPDSLLWYRMGDFYELFFEDAVVAADALSIVLTKRGKHLGEDIPMCGVPVHRADEYLQRLIKLGHRVAVCEQLEDPAEARKRGAKAIVQRDVVRLVTPGTLTEDALLDAKARNYLTAVFAQGASGDESGAGAQVTLASLDISTGEFEISTVGPNDLAGEIMRLSPSEIIASDKFLSNGTIERAASIVQCAVTPVPGATFDSLSGERALRDALDVADLGAFGTFERGEFAAIGGLLKYVELTQVGAKPAIRPPRRAGAGAVMIIDAASRASLELLKSASGDRTGSLLGAIDRTVTGAGSRELAARIASPLCDVDAISARLDAVAYLVDAVDLRDDLREALRRTPDVARAVSRIALQRASPRDLGAVRDAIATGVECAHRLKQHADQLTSTLGLPEDLAEISRALLQPPGTLGSALTLALVDEPTGAKREGGYIRSGFCEALDEARALRDDSRKVMAALEAAYVEQTGIKTLKVRHNNILGYFIEVGAASAKPMLEPPLNDTFRHRQTMANAVRFTTVRLNETEGKIAAAGERALAIEADTFGELSAQIMSHDRELGELGAALAALDCLTALGELAEAENYARPVIDTSYAFVVRAGRHPMVEQALKRDRAGPFIANDCVLSVPSPQSIGSDMAGAYPPGFDETNTGRIWLLTGPNMAGKSTFLRQNALIALMGQMGSFVPADSAHIGVVDRLFSRVGASDDIASGRSTFMVEMVETAGILNAATERSFVILDEIGRGTATFDGLSIAWASVEHLHDVNGSRALFATHYHELTALPDRLAQIANVTVDVKEWRDEIVFLHSIRPGAADRSYGIQVARLAGLPKAVTARAKDVLKILEDGNTKNGSAGPLEALPLFAAVAHESAAQPASPSAVDKMIDETNPDELSPRAALELIYQLKKLSQSAD